MVAGMLNSLLGAFVVVFVMMVLLFRSLPWGLVAMLPLTLTILGVYGVIGWVGKYYDMPIAVLSSLTLGLSVDFAIHFIQRTRELYAAAGQFREDGGRPCSKSRPGPFHATPLSLRWVSRPCSWRR